MIKPSTPKEFGKQLRKFLYGKRNMSLLPDCGWLDGGCRSLMKALQIWLDEENVNTYAIMSEENEEHCDHAFIKVGELFIDGDGVSTEKEMYERWLYEEMLPEVYIYPFDPINEPPSEDGTLPVYISEEAIQTLVNRLEKRFDKRHVLYLFGIYIPSK